MELYCIAFKVGLDWSFSAPQHTYFAINGVKKCGEGATHPITSVDGSFAIAFITAFKKSVVLDCSDKITLHRVKLNIEVKVLAT